MKEKRTHDGVYRVCPSTHCCILEVLITYNHEAFNWKCNQDCKLYSGDVISQVHRCLSVAGRSTAPFMRGGWMKVQQPRRTNPRATRITGVGDAWAALDVQLSTICPRKSNTNFKDNSVNVLGVGRLPTKYHKRYNSLERQLEGLVTNQHRFWTQNGSQVISWNLEDVFTIFIAQIFLDVQKILEHLIKTKTKII